MTLIKAQLSLIKLWIFALIPIVVLTLGRTFGTTKAGMTDIWKSVAPAILPSLATVLGTFSFTNFGEHAYKQVNVTFFKITYWVSVCYLASFVIMFAIYPSIDPGLNHTSAEILESFVKFLEGLDATVVAACLGVFFTSKHAQSPAMNKD